MLPLAITSTAGWIRRLGGKRWNRLHRLVYLTGILGPLHYWWLVKADVSRPLTYAAVVALLLGARVFWNRARRLARSSRPRAGDARVRAAVGVMARAPSSAGKTRLAPHFSPDRLAALRARAARRHAARARDACQTSCIFFTPDEPLSRGRADRGSARRWPRLPQGRRRSRRPACVRAVQHLLDARQLRRGAARRSDIPLLGCRSLREAVGTLQASGGVVLGPADDGGYYLIGMTAGARRACSRGSPGGPGAC